MASQMGNETRTSILPTNDPGAPGFLGPDYDPSDMIPLPGQVGVYRGSSLGAAVSALKATSYYVDTIGFGQPSNPFFKSVYPVKIYGINYFMPTGIKCDNGADMYEYIETIPKGDALGTAVQKGLASTGLPQLRGLAPGAVEDAKAALNPAPLMRSLTGSGYAKCVLMENAFVGDLNGDFTGDIGPVATTYNPGTRTFIKTQTRWVSAKDRRGNPITITKEQYDNTPKIYNPDGSLKKTNKEGFYSFGSNSPLPVLFAGVLAVGGMAVLKIMASK
jgi:hypothetical protein